MMRTYNWLVSPCVMAMCLALPAVASITGSIFGVVTEPHGAVVAGAGVSVIEAQTAVQSTSVSDAKGVYTFPALPVGKYNLTVSRPGFREFGQTGLRIDANSALRVDVKIEVGSVIQETMVASNGAQVETQNTQMGEVIVSNKITSVPLNGRSFTDLLSLQPGVSPYQNVGITGDRPGSGGLNAGNQSVNGQREG